MARMDKKWVVLCSTAIAAVYTAGYWTTEGQTMGDLSLQPSQTNLTASAKVGTGAAAPNSPQLPIAATPTMETHTSKNSSTAEAYAAPATQQLKGTAPSASPTATPTQSKAAQATSTVSPKPTITATATPSVTPKPTTAATATPSVTSKPATVTTPPQGKRYKDGTFSGEGRNRRGSIGVSVTIKNDKITDVEISQFAMHYSERDVIGLPSEVLQKQSAQVANVSGATYSVQAFKDAVQSALAQAFNS